MTRTLPSLTCANTQAWDSKNTIASIRSVKETLLVAYPNLRFQYQARAVCYLRSRITKIMAQRRLFHIRLSTKPGTVQNIQQANYCRRSLHLVDPSTSTLHEVVAVLAHHRRHTTTMSAHRLIPWTAQDTSGGQQAMRRHRLRLIRARWHRYRIGLLRTDLATTPTIRCQSTHRLHITTTDRLRRMCYIRTPLPCNRAIQHCSRILNSLITWRCHGHSHRKAYSGYFRATQIGTEVVPRILQTYRTHQIFIRRYMKNPPTRQSLT
jgi:hypothetical protein